uniref:THAP-type domain-containing protein n=1 Tax=Clytia hemisphaerica TaxID=252671 RepID=A0A7M5V9Y6_9CNID
MVHCCIPGCKNTHHHKTKKEEWHVDTRNYSLHDLPSEDRMEIRELWILAINRSTLPKDVAVCSDHFTEDCFDEKWEEYKRKYGPTKVKRKLKLDAVPTIFPGRMFYHEKVQHIKESWKNKVLQRRLEYERLRLEKEYRDRFKSTQTECQCKCRCKLRKKNFGQQVNFQFKFMEDVGVQFPKDLTETVKDDHSYTQGGKKKSKTGLVNNKPLVITTDPQSVLNIIQSEPQPTVVPSYTIDFEAVTGNTATQTPLIDHKDATAHFVMAENIQTDILGFQLKHKLVEEGPLCDDNSLEKRQRLEPEALPETLISESQILPN